MLKSKLIQGMANVRHGLVASWATPMFGNALIADDDAQPLIEHFDDCITMCPATWTRVPIRLVR